MGDISGARLAERLLTKPEGATMAEIIRATGGPQYNVLKRLEARGFAIRKVKERSGTRYFAEPPDDTSFEATVGDNGQVTIPKTVRERLGLRGRQVVAFTTEAGGRAVLTPVYRRLSDVGSVLPKPKRSMTLEEMDEAIRDAATGRDE